MECPLEGWRVDALGLGGVHGHLDLRAEVDLLEEGGGAFAWRVVVFRE